MTGKHPTFSIAELFGQLNPNDNMIVGLHWREYSPQDTVRLFTPLGFELETLRLTSDTGSTSGSFLKQLAKRIVYVIPGAAHTQVAVFRKTRQVSLGSLGLVVNPDS